MGSIVTTPYPGVCFRFAPYRRSPRQSVRAAQVAGRARSTVRLLESLLRLTQAHARLRCSPTVDLCDAVTAVTLMEASLGGLGGGLLGPDGVGHILHTAFPDSPRDEYRAQCERWNRWKGGRSWWFQVVNLKYGRVL